MTDRKTIFVVCRGACTLSGEKPGTSYSYVNLDGTLGDEFALMRKSKVLGSAVIGGVYELAQEGDTFYGPAKWVRAWANEADVLGWKASADLVQARERDAKQRKSGEQEARDQAMLALEPIRHLYHRTDMIGRRLLIAAMIEYVQRNPAYDGTR